MMITTRKPAHRISISEREEYRSPLRYPGGKQRAATAIADLFDQFKLPPGSRFASPFMGGGSVELELCRRGFTVKASDAFLPVAAFWQQLKKDPAALHAAVGEYRPISKVEFYAHQEELRRLLNNPAPCLQRVATLFFILNRSSFSGATLSGGMGSADRFTRNAINRLLNVNCKGLEMADAGDYWERLFKNSRAGARFRYSAIYADPPYWLEESKLYGDGGSTHKDFDHGTFARRMNNLRQHGAPIVISYNDCAGVRDTFAGWKFREIKWAYGMNASKQSNEVLITNF
jgi:DNA adenine methylase